MQHSIETISLAHLAIAFIPVALVIGIIWKWNVGHKNASYAVLRMLIQLLLIGYLLTFIFESDSYAMVIAILFIMISASTWIALNSINEHRKSLYLRAFYAIGIGGGLILVFSQLSNSPSRDDICQLDEQREPFCRTLILGR